MGGKIGGVYIKRIQILSRSGLAGTNLSVSDGSNGGGAKNKYKSLLTADFSLCVFTFIGRMTKSPHCRTLGTFV